MAKERGSQGRLESMLIAMLTEFRQHQLSQKQFLALMSVRSEST